MTFVKAQFMDPPGGAAAIGAVSAGTGITISAEGVISTTASGGTVTNIVPNNGIQGGGTGPTVFLGLLPPTGTDLGGVRTIEGSGLSIDNVGIIRVASTIQINGGPGIETQDLGGNVFSVSALPATSSVLGSVIVPSGGGLQLQASGALSVLPASSLRLGGVKAGTGVTIAADGTLNATGSGGTITGVGVGTGLGGGGTTGAVTLFLRPAGFGAPDNIGGVYAGDNVTIDADGKINVATSTSGVQTVTAGDSITVSGTAADPIISAQAGSLTQPGVLQNVNDVNSSLTDGFAATPLAVKTVADQVANKLDLSGGTMSGIINFETGQSFPGTLPPSAYTTLGGMLVGTGNPANPYGQVIPGSNGQILTANSLAPEGLSWSDLPAATTSSLGAVQPDGTTITITAGGVITSNSGMANPMTTIGDIIYSQSTGTPGTPARLGAGANNTILAIVAGMPAWRSSTQLGLLTSSFAASTYAPLDTPTFSGPVTVNASGASGANALVVTGGNLVLSTSYTPPSSSSTGSVGELAWDNQFLYFCYQPNTWGRVAVDLTPF
jgi:hypothetical protein